MAAIPATISGRLFDKTNKTEQQVTLIGMFSLTGVGVGGGPIAPPPDIKPEPPLTIWGGPFDPPHPAHPIELPPLPDEPPPTPQKPHEGWNWSEAKGGWYLLYVPGEDEARPKR